MKLFEITQEYKIFCDMDGVLADFVSGVSGMLGVPLEDGRYDLDPEYKKRMWKAVSKHQKAGGELWYELDLMPDAMELWRYIAPYNPEILSAGGNPQHKAEGQKQRWIVKHFGPHVKVNVTRLAADKARYAAPNHILIDDKEKALGPWRDAGGIGVLHTSAANTIRQLKDLGL